MAKKSTATKTIYARVNEDVKNKLDDYVKDNGMSLAQAVEEILIEGLIIIKKNGHLTTERIRK